ncbi:acylphosphatase [Lacticaseibacillus hegangensis]|uniref:Acylphosphatase n=1 Tax=Lacticaseibacillus hegangensis TaxID=2486010 RepID=A0ABW4CY65_9LACO|nr:acylphosphatase [Lacticaseibacillus hegangensis]
MRKKLTFHGKLSEGGVKYVAQRYAMQLHLTGVSSKAPDGTVVVEVQGSPDAIDQFKQKMSAGNQFYSVDSVDEEEIPEATEKMFRIG